MTHNPTPPHSSAHESAARHASVHADQAAPPTAVVPDAEQVVLLARARALAQPPADALSGTSLQVLVFCLAHERYAVDIDAVREVCPLKSLTPLPGVPDFVMGIVNIRGQVVSVLDLKRFFGLPETGLTDMNKIILLADEKMEFGLLADAVIGVLMVDSEALAQTSLPLNDARLPYLKGVTADHLILLDARQLLNDPRMVVDEDVE